MSTNRPNSLTPAERIRQLEELLQTQQQSLSTLEVERDLLRAIVQGDYHEPPTLKIGQRLGELLPTTGVGAERTVRRLESVGDILKKRSGK